jgi:hypothetical protein
MHKKHLFLITFILLVITLPSVKASDDCGLTNLATCLPQKAVEFVIGIFNAPVESLLGDIQDLLTEPVNIEQFKGLWQIMIYILSIFYGLFLLFAGYQFIVSGHDVIKRETAKEWLKNIIFMIIFVQASYILYGVLLEIGASLSAGVINLIDPEFFLLTADSISSVGLQFIFSSIYILTLTNTLVFLFLRYFLVSFGIVLFPIGLFLYFVPPLKSYGKMVIEGTFILILLPFIQSLILLIGSKLIGLPIVSNLKILVMISSFTLLNLAMIFLVLFAGIKAVSYVGDLGGSIGKAVKYIAG